MPYKKIADKLGITENTVRSRANKLQDMNVLEICGLVDPDKLPDHQIMVMGIKASDTILTEKCEKIIKIKGVVSVSLTTGRYDMLILVFLQKGFGMIEFYAEELSKIPGIKFAEKFIVHKSFNLKVPYIY